MDSLGIYGSDDVEMGKEQMEELDVELPMFSEQFSMADSSFEMDLDVGTDPFNIRSKSRIDAYFQESSLSHPSPSLIERSGPNSFPFLMPESPDEAFSRSQSNSISVLPPNSPDELSSSSRSPSF